MSELPTERIRSARFAALYEENYHLILGLRATTGGWG